MATVDDGTGHRVEPSRVRSRLELRQCTIFRKKAAVDIVVYRDLRGSRGDTGAQCQQIA